MRSRWPSSGYLYVWLGGDPGRLETAAPEAGKTAPFVLPYRASVGFINPDKTPVESTVAWTTDCSFETFRREGEDEAAFRARAHSECRAADPRPVQILIFSDKEIPQ